MKRKFLIISAFLAALMLLSACDGNKSPGAGTEAGTESGTAPPETEAETVPDTIPETEDETEPETVTLVEEFDDGIKLYSNGVLDFGEIIGNDEEKRLYKFLVMASSDENCPQALLNAKKIVCGHLEMKVHFFRNDNGYPCKLESITAYGHTQSYVDIDKNDDSDDDGTLFISNSDVLLFEVDGRIVFAQRNLIVANEGMAASTTFILQKDGIYQIKNPIPSGVMAYNSPNITLYKDDNGRLCYRKMLIKFFGNQTEGGELEYCTARDEFCCEYGSVSFDGITPIYTAEKIETVSDHFDIEKVYKRWKDTMGLPYETLDEYLAHNAEIFQRGY